MVQTVRRVLGAYGQWKDACRRDITVAELREDDVRNRAAWRNKVMNYVTARMGQASDNDEDDAMK